MKLNWVNDIAGTPLSGIGATATRECRHRLASRNVQQSPGTSVSFYGQTVPFAMAGDVEVVSPMPRRMTADLPAQFWVPLCPQESVP